MNNSPSLGCVKGRNLGVYMHWLDFLPFSHIHSQTTVLLFLSLKNSFLSSVDSFPSSKRNSFLVSSVCRLNLMCAFINTLPDLCPSSIQFLCFSCLLFVFNCPQFRPSFPCVFSPSQYAHISLVLPRLLGACFSVLVFPLSIVASSTRFARKKLCLLAFIYLLAMVWYFVSTLARWCFLLYFSSQKLFLFSTVSQTWDTSPPVLLVFLGHAFLI